MSAQNIMPIVAIRAEPGLSATLQMAAAMELPITGFALSRAEPVPWEAPDPAQFDAILAGSANTFRHGRAGLQNLTDLPVYAVGKQTAKLASEAGFQIAAIGEGGLQNLLDNSGDMPPRLLRLTGAAHVPLNAPRGCVISTVVAYRMTHLPLPDQLAAILRNQCVVLLHSGEAAKHLRAQCHEAAISIRSIHIAAFAPRIAATAGDGWASVHCAETPQDADLLALAKRIAQL